MVSNNQLILFIIYFSVFSVAKTLLVATEAETLCAEGENQSKCIKICETNPIFKTPKMIVTLVTATTTNKKQRTMNYLKRTQTNPILSAYVADKIALSEVEGPYLDVFSVFQSALRFRWSERICTSLASIRPSAFISPER